MFVQKRSGKKAVMRFDRISDRITELSQGLNVDAPYITKQIIGGIIDGIKTSEIDTLCAETCISLSTYNIDYGLLASRIFVSNLHKETAGNYKNTLKALLENKDKDGIPVPLMAQDVVEFAMENIDIIEANINYSRDYNYAYFGLKTLEKSYLLKGTVSGKIIERPQHMLMRVALGIHYPRVLENGKEDSEKCLKNTLESYHALSKKLFIHGSPCLFNAGTNRPQLASCFLLYVADDLVEIYTKKLQAALLSKFAGGIGMNISDIRCAGSPIRSNGGFSNGILPLLRTLDADTKYINQSSKRPGSTAIYLNPWHGEISEFLELKLNDGSPSDLRTPNLFTGLFIEDLFMERVEKDEIWSLFCPDRVRGLTDAYGDDFKKLYEQAEKDKKYIKQVKARTIWRKILESQIATGQPYMLYKDACNLKSNQKNIGTIKGSNLCTEILQYTSPNNISVCNLASLSLPAFVENGVFNYEKLMEITRIAVRNLNRNVEFSFLPVEIAAKTNKKQFAIGLGVQGLQDTFFIMKFPIDSKEAADLNIRIFESIYYAAWDESANQVQNEGYPIYSYFEGSPISQGILQCDMWNVSPITNYDWNGLREKVKKGVRNSLISTCMPCASTGSVLGNTESIECLTSNIYMRKVLSGDFPIVNSYLVKDLEKLGLWKREIVDQIIKEEGSIKNILEIPEEIRNLYKIVWDLPQKVIVDLSCGRAPFIDQTQSLNIHKDYPTISWLSSLHFDTHKRGLKTGMYYLRTKTALNPMAAGSLGILTEKEEKNKKVPEEEILKISKKANYVCEEEICVSCSG